MAAESFGPEVYYIVKAKSSKRSKKSKRKDARKQENKHDSAKNPSSSVPEVDEKKRQFVMDLSPIGGANYFQVGSLDQIIKEVKSFFARKSRKESWMVKEICVNPHAIHLNHNKNLDCPILQLYHRKEGPLYSSSSSIKVYALTGNLSDILQVLLQVNVSSFDLQFINEKYIAEVKEFFSTNPHLSTLRIGKHYLKNDQGLVRDIVKSSESLFTLEIDYDFTTKPEKGLNDYMRHIFESKSLRKLDLSNIRNLSQDQIDSLAAGLEEKSSKLQTIDMSVSSRYRFVSNVKIDIARLTKVFRHHDSLEELNLSGRTLAGSDSILGCSKLLKHSKSLKRLDLRAFRHPNRHAGNHLNHHPDVWTCIGKALPKACSLQHLDISHHSISEAAWKALGEGLKANNSLLTFRAERAFDQRDKKETNILLPVFEALHTNTTLQSLHLIGYDLSDSFASLEMLESALIGSTSVKSLKLEESAMTDEGVEILSRSLSKMKGIEELDLEHHGFSLKGAKALARGARSNFSLLAVAAGTKSRLRRSTLDELPIEAEGFEKEWHEIQYYARMNRKGRRCLWTKTPIKPSLWPLILERALKQEEKSLGWLLIDGDVRKANRNPLGLGLVEGDVREKDWFAGKHDTSIDAVFLLLRNVVQLPVAFE